MPVSYNRRRAAPERRAVSISRNLPSSGRVRLPSWAALLLFSVAGVANAVGDAPGNDSCAEATIVSTNPFRHAVLTIEAIGDPADPSPPCGNESSANSVWYRLAANEAAAVTVTTVGSDYDTILSVYEGSCDRLTPVPDGCNDDDPRDGAQSTVSFPATAGATYHLMVSAFDGDGGALAFELSFRRAPLCIGDCDGDGGLTSNECDLCDDIHLGGPLTLCPPCDGDGDGQVAAREVNQCLLGIDDCVPCVGDCDGSGAVTASDLVTATSIVALCPCANGTGGAAVGCPALPTSVASCGAADRDGDGCLSEDELTLLLGNVFQCGR